MTLKDYLKRYGIKAEEFADLIGVDRSTVSRIINGHAPGPQTVIAIYNETGGKVGPKDLFSAALEKQG